MNKALSILSLFLLFGTVASAQLDKSTFEKQVYQNEGFSLNYRILYPEGFDANKEYPVVLFLHGAGERGSDNERQLIHGSKLFLAEDFRADYPVVVIFPQCPRESYWSTVDVERQPGNNRFTFRDSGKALPPMKAVVALMDSIQSLEYSKDDQIYVGGLSMGGLGTFEILWRRPEMFAAAFPICGGGNPSTVDAYAANTSLWVFHGAKDDVVFPTYSTDMVIALQKADADVKYTLYKNANHNSWGPAFAEPQLFPWLFSKSKK
ncbi:carboxylesterase family protein [Marinoscillum furvescens]|uniref:Putative esterase n=1 Tax=Marinoscillum furvescens DSM 4134 TaxID=1122208 RepID=A0A3D9KZV2_MARFU|nr:prolyl oligopeptidase family serine peptidase [Marinoscillum furvescens]RED96180.1 putative esterase [Marinoscillum furvescens DSM 4134]